MDNELVNAFLTMQDLSAQEKQLAQQQAMAQQLRTGAMGPSAGKDFGSQGARALQGVGALIGGIQSKKSAGEYAKAKQDTLDRFMRLSQPRQPMQQQPNVIQQPYQDEYQ